MESAQRSDEAVVDGGCQSERAALSSGGPSSPIARCRPLGDDEIRLVDFGAQGEEPILVVAHIDELPEYTAISYCWGDENCLHRFEINDQALIVHSSLLVVLRELRARGFKGKIWADAVCIDQSSELEKAVQIPLMGSIYRNASSVLAWIGDAGPDNALSPEFMVRLANLFSETELEEQRKAIGMKQSFEQAVERLHLPPAEHRVWSDLMEMFHSPWFERVWTLQEAIIANNLEMGYGRIRFSWSTLFWAQLNLHAIDFEDRKWQRQFREVNYSVINQIYNIEMHRENHAQGSLWMGVILLDAQHRRCSNAQDKVYAVYNLMTPAVQALLPVDLSASVQRIFIRATKAVLSADPRGFFLFASAASRSVHQRLPGLPSWVPDFTTLPSVLRMTGYYAHDAGRVSECLARPQVSLVDGEDSLGFEGFPLDVVTYVCSVALGSDLPTGTPHTRYQQVLPYVQDCLDALRAARDLPEDELFQRLGQALVCGTSGSWSGWRYERCSDGMSDDLRNNIRYWQGVPMEENADEAKVSRYRRRLEKLTTACSFFITKSGYFGLGVYDLEVGDEIVILNGTQVPFAIRRRPCGSLYQYLGECYVDSVMDGEAFDAYEESGKAFQTFTFD